MTSFYCLLAYIPFTHQWVIKCPVLPWLPVFARLHTFLYWAAFGLMATTSVADIRRPKTRRITVWFMIFHAVIGVALLLRPLLVDIPDDERSFVWSLIALFSLLWVAAIDYLGHAEETGRDVAKKREARLGLSAAVLSAIFVALLYLGIFNLRYVLTGAVRLRWFEHLTIIFWSILSHLFLFLSVFILLKLVRAISGRFAAARKIEFFISYFLASLAGMMILRKIILSAISFNTYGADVFAVVASLSVVAFLFGLVIRLGGSDDEEARSESAFARSPLCSLRSSSRRTRALCVLALAAFAYVVPASIERTDWNFLLQELLAILIWAMAFVLFCAITSRPKEKQYSPGVLLLVAVLSLGGYGVMELSRSRIPLLQDGGLHVSATLERYADYDISFRVVRDILSPSLYTGLNPISVDSRQAFYVFLQRNTHVGENVRPVEVNLVDHLARTDTEKPNIFIFVIDSLRKDYVSPYNKGVKFTPSIGRFARESVVMENAFTHYGGTTLAEPSIWVGGMMLHKQYVQPFQPMNALQKLIDAEDYQKFITVDPVLGTILQPSPSTVEMDQGRAWWDYDLCRSLEELESKIDARQASAQPIFTYIQPQNLHTTTLAHIKGNDAPQGQEYDGFDPLYAAQLKRLDAGFGDFIDYLKARGLYDNSIVILTADHGDMLGDGGWGHAYTIFPDVIRVPLIIHLPPRLQKGLFWDAKSVAFSTDIAPSLYYLLGHRPVVQNELFGRPLFTAEEKEQTAYRRDSYLIASSYGPVYGLLAHNGRSLFIADAIHGKDYFYDLADDPQGTRNLVTDAVRAENEKLIRSHILSINRFYNYDPDRLAQRSLMEQIRDFFHLLYGE
jgi:arylsulfatase A-like enzyme